MSEQICRGDPDNVPVKLVPDCDQGAANQLASDVIVVP
jgi:hypothetical protein